MYLLCIFAKRAHIDIREHYHMLFKNMEQFEAIRKDEGEEPLLTKSGKVSRRKIIIRLITFFGLFYAIYISVLLLDLFKHQKPNEIFRVLGIISIIYNLLLNIAAASIILKKQEYSIEYDFMYKRNLLVLPITWGCCAITGNY
jgi:hypothetical protein